MKKAAVIYWSGTNNTFNMAKAVYEGMKDVDALLLHVNEVDENIIEEMDSIAFGCPSMGDETLEETEFEPMFNKYKDKLQNKKIALFGSYGWGDGEWMRNWEEDCHNSNITLACDSIICLEDPDEDVIKQLKIMGEILVK